MKILTIAVIFVIGTEARALDFLAFGDIRGNLEPCGCDPATDLGGVARIKSAIDREKLSHDDLLVFSLGNNFPEIPEEQAKAHFLDKALNAIAPTASLFNELEIVQNAQEKNSALTDLRYVLFNQRIPMKSVRRTLQFNRIWLTGFVSPREKSNASLLPLNSVLTELKAAALGAKKTKVLLYSGTEVDLKVLSEAKLFDLIISSNSSPIGQNPGQEERQDEGKLVRLAEIKNSNGEIGQVLMVPLGGQGMLRGGALQIAAAKSLSDIMKEPICTKPLGCKPTLKAEKVTWLTKDYSDDSLVQTIVDKYFEQESAAFRKSAKRKLAAMGQSPYVGSAACSGCHQREYKVWQESRHSQAFMTLKENGKNEVSECVSCHVAGFDQGGFISITHTEHLANVQCENCHGPRRTHISSEKKTKIANVKEDVCTTCHHPPHSSAFTFEEYWPKIAHGSDSPTKP
jgi:hypothetical protein